MGKLTARLLPEGVAPAPEPEKVHWLLLTVPDPTLTGADHVVPASFMRLKVLLPALNCSQQLLTVETALPTRI